jgi:DNA polymerase (family 10)
MEINTLILSEQLLRLSQLTSETFKSRAYHRAATSILTISDDDLNSRDEFSDIKGVGNSINEKIKAFKQTGFVPGITAADMLVKSNMIKERVGFNTTRIPIQKCYAIINSKLLAVKDKMILVGSLRRGVPYIADIDALVDEKDFKDMVEYLSEEFKMLVTGATKASFIVDEENMIQLDINIVNKTNMAFALLHHTGSANHNIKLRAIAKKRGLILNQYGLFTDDEKPEDRKRMHFNTEEEIFQELGVPYVEPKNRK